MRQRRNRRTARPSGSAVAVFQTRGEVRTMAEEKAGGNPVAEKAAGNPNGEAEAPECPENLRWVQGMLGVLPLGMGGKLEPFRKCIVPRPKSEESEGSPE